jgi:hypothetical protein
LSDLSDRGEAFSLARNDLPFRLQRRIGLVPRDGGAGIARRALFWAALTWAPIALWAWATGRAVDWQGQAAEPLLSHFGVHARLLFAVPVFIVAEAIANRMTAQILPQFVHSDVVRASDVPRFDALLADAVRLRDALSPWMIIVGLAVAWTLTGTFTSPTHDVAWAADGPAPTSLGFGGMWYAYVGRPVFIVLILAWLWRLILLGTLLWRISRLDLDLVPTHPDRAAGLGFLNHLPAAFSLVILAPATVIASVWVHDIKYHGLAVDSLYPMMAAALAIAAVVILSPYVAFAGQLFRVRQRALLDYGALVSRHGRGVRRKWILGETKSDDPLLSAPEIGPVADTLALFDAVQRTRIVPIGRIALLAVALPVAIPFLGVLAMRIPLGELLVQLGKTLL